MDKGTEYVIPWEFIRESDPLFRKPELRQYIISVLTRHRDSIYTHRAYSLFTQMEQAIDHKELFQSIFELDQEIGNAWPQNNANG